jgi:hypothetical protein
VVWDIHAHSIDIRTVSLVVLSRGLLIHILVVTRITACCYWRFGRVCLFYLHESRFQVYAKRTYGIQLRGSESNSHLEILDRFQSKLLQILTDAPWYVPNAVIRRDLQVPTVRQKVRNCSVTYRQRLTDHPNSLANSLFQGLNCNRKLKRHYSVDLATRL